MEYHVQLFCGLREFLFFLFIYLVHVSSSLHVECLLGFTRNCTWCCQLKLWLKSGQKISKNHAINCEIYSFFYSQIRSSLQYNRLLDFSFTIQNTVQHKINLKIVTLKRNIFCHFGCSLFLPS